MDSVAARSARTSAGAEDGSMPLVVTADEDLLEDALRLCAAVGATPIVATDLTAARRSWKLASAVLVGEDLAAGLARTEPSRRDGVVLIGASGDWPSAVALGAERVCELPRDQDILIDLLANALEGKGEACVVSVMGGCGGAGATTLAAALALRGARRGFSSLLLDADAYGGGIDLVLGHENIEGMRWPDLDRTLGRVSGESLRQVLPSKAGLSTLSWDRGDPLDALLPDSMHAVLTAASRAFDLVVADVPRIFDGVAEEILGRSVLTVVLVPEDIHALGAAGRILSRVQRLSGSVALLTRARRGGIGAAAVSANLGLPVIGRIRHQRSLAANLDSGDGPGRSRTLRSGSNAILDALGLT